MLGSTSSSSSRPTVDGLISGIASSTIIDAFIAADRSATKVVENRKTVQKAQLEAVRSFNAKLLSAQLDLSSLKQTSTFKARLATSSNTDALTISKAGTSAVPGTYIIDVVAVATSAQKSTAGIASADAALSPGTVSLQLGSGQATQLNFSSGGSLNDIASAINGAAIGINASVINDGSNSPYRLVLKGEKTGLANTLTVTGTLGLESLFTGMTALSTPADAKVKIGTDTNFIEVIQASNTFSNIVPGVDFDAVKEANDINITVKADTTTAKDGIKKFVDSLNTAITYLKENTSFDGVTGKGGALIGQSSLVSGLGRLMRTLTGSVAGLPTSLNSLSSIGIRLDQTKGTLSIDNTVLAEKLSSNPEGVAKLFNNTGTSSNPAIQFAYLNEKTKTENPFIVNVTQPPLQATLASTDLGSSININNSNNSLVLSINDHPITVTLTNKANYTRDELAQHVNSAINAAITSPGDALSVTRTGDRLDIRSNLYGQTQKIFALGQSTALSALGLTAQNVFGSNVAGTINGVAAIGNGKVLVGATGSAADGLSLSVTSAVAVSGVSVTVNKGLGQLITERFSSLTNNTSGAIAAVDKTLSNNITSADKQIVKADLLLEQRRQRYTKQFLAMEKLIAGFKSQGDAMTGFVNALTRNNNS